MGSTIRTEDRVDYANDVHRTRNDGIMEVVKLDWWASIDAIKAFVGDDHLRTGRSRGGH
jgi:hypothetical protein